MVGTSRRLRGRADRPRFRPGLGLAGRSHPATSVELAEQRAIPWRMLAQPGEVLPPVRSHRPADCAGFPYCSATGNEDHELLWQGPWEVARTLALQQSIE